MAKREELLNNDQARFAHSHKKFNNYHHHFVSAPLFYPFLFLNFNRRERVVGTQWKCDLDALRVLWCKPIVLQHTVQGSLKWCKVVQNSTNIVYYKVTVGHRRMLCGRWDLCFVSSYVALYFVVLPNINRMCFCNTNIQTRLVIKLWYNLLPFSRTKNGANLTFDNFSDFSTKALHD